MVHLSVRFSSHNTACICPFSCACHMLSPYHLPWFADRSSIAESEREGTRAETRIGLSAKRTSPFKSAGGQFSRLLDRPCSDEGCKTTGYPLHSHLFPSLPLPCVTVCRLIPIELYLPVVCVCVCGERERERESGGTTVIRSAAFIKGDPNNS